MLYKQQAVGDYSGSLLAYWLKQKPVHLGRIQKREPENYFMGGGSRKELIRGMISAFFPDRIDQRRKDVTEK
jgi:hypothetical protein